MTNPDLSEISANIKAIQSAVAEIRGILFRFTNAEYQRYEEEKVRRRERGY